MLADGTRLLTLTGPGGGGKTRLALAAASESVGDSEDGAWWVGLAPLSDPDLLPQTVASVFGVRERPGHSITEAISDSLGSKRLLLVLDNCEHLIGACARIVDVNLTLKGFSHDSPTETDFMLVHAGVNRTVMSDAGGIVEVGGLNVTLDDQAKAQLPEGFNDPLTSGKFKPANYSGNGEGFDPPAPTPSGLSALGGFRGKNPEGAWQLFVDDQFNTGEGFLGQGYSLKIKAKFRP